MYNHEGCSLAPPGKSGKDPVSRRSQSKGGVPSYYSCCHIYTQKLTGNVTHKLDNPAAKPSQQDLWEASQVIMPAGDDEWQDDECVLSQNVQDAIADVLPSDDPIDQANFDAIDFINQNFPSDDQKSLDKIDPFVSTLSENITKLDGELSSAVQKQATAGHRAAEDIKEAKHAIDELFTKIKDIKGKAEQSEVMVAEICKDIKQLDYAKRHIQETITALKRLHMVVTAVEQLKAMSTTKQYREAANLLEAVKQLLTHFEQYSNIPKILELKSSISKLRSDLKTQVFKDFLDIGELGEAAEDDAPDESTLIAACAVIDALGDTEKEELVTTFIHQQMRPYAIAFKKGKEEAGLSGTDRYLICTHLILLISYYSSHTTHLMLLVSYSSS
jgi:hypothetical protein